MKVTPHNNGPGAAHVPARLKTHKVDTRLSGPMERAKHR